MKFKNLVITVFICQSACLYGTLSQSFQEWGKKAAAYNNMNLMSQSLPSRVEIISNVYNIGSDVADEVRNILSESDAGIQRLNDLLRIYRKYLHDLEDAPNQNALDAIQANMSRTIIPAVLKQIVIITGKSREILDKAGNKAIRNGTSQGTVNRINQLAQQLLELGVKADRLAVYKIRSDTNTGLRDLEIRLKLIKKIIVDAEAILGANSRPIKNLREQVGVLERDIKDVKELYYEGNETNMRLEMERVSRSTAQEALKYAARVARLAASK